MTIRVAEPSDHDRWDAYASAHPDGFAYHRWAWKEAVERVYRFACPYLLAEEDGRIRGMLPLVHLKPPLLRGQLVSLPYCDVGGPLADDTATELALLDGARAEALGRDARGVELRRVAPSGRAKAGSAATEKVRMVLELPGSPDDLMAGFKAKHRSQVRKPERDGLTARLGGVELVGEFYSVFSENMRDLGSPVHSRKWIAAVVTGYGEDCRVGVVSLPGGEIAAAGIILAHGTTVSVPWASSLRRYNRANPNMLLYWSFLAFACERGFTRFDFGRSTPGEGTFRFKEQWGARSQPLHWVRLSNGAPGVQGRGSRGVGIARRAAETVIRRLPVRLATSLGSVLRPYVSL